MNIPDEIRKPVVFLLYTNKERKLTLAGTGFFVSVIHPEIGDRLNFIYLVTAKHVVVAVRLKSIDQKVLIRINDLKGGCRTVESTVDQWIDHPTDTSVDTSVLPWAPPTDVFEFKTIPEKMFATEEVIAREEIGLGDEVFITGLFASHYGKAKNIPIVRVGNIASMPEEKVDTKSFGSIDAYLIEARSIGGLSGSPVFVNLSGYRNNQLRGRVFYLLGLIHGHWDTQDKAIDGLVEDVDSEGKVNMGIAMVVPSSRILEVINQPQFVEDRQAVADAEKQKRLPVEDTGAEHIRETISEDNPQESVTREEFKDAQKRVARPLKEDEQPNKDKSES